MDAAFGAIRQIDAKLSSSKLFLGLVMLLMNIGARYFSVHLSETQEMYLRENVARELIIFAIVWTATRDILVSLMVTILFVLMADYLFNENSRLCVIPKCVLREIELKKSRLSGVDKVSESDERKALEVLEKSRRQKELEAQAIFVNAFANI